MGCCNHYDADLYDTGVGRPVYRGVGEGRVLEGTYKDGQSRLDGDVEDSKEGIEDSRIS